MKKLLFIIVLFICHLSCTRTIYVPLESVKTEYRDNYFRDSIHVQDSIYFAVQGDTIRIEKYKTLYRDRIVKDSVILTDSISVPVPVPGPVEYRTPKWCWWLLSISILYIIFLIVKRRLHF